MNAVLFQPFLNNSVVHTLKLYYIVIHLIFILMDTTLSIRIDKDLESLLNEAAKRTGRPKSELVREALRRQLSIESFQQIRKRILPFAESQGLLTDEDVWREIS